MDYATLHAAGGRQRVVFLAAAGQRGVSARARDARSPPSFCRDAAPRSAAGLLGAPAAPRVRRLPMGVLSPLFRRDLPARQLLLAPSLVSCAPLPLLGARAAALPVLAERSRTGTAAVDRAGVRGTGRPPLARAAARPRATPALVVFSRATHAHERLVESCDAVRRLHLWLRPGRRAGARCRNGRAVAPSPRDGRRDDDTPPHRDVGRRTPRPTPRPIRARLSRVLDRVCHRRVGVDGRRPRRGAPVAQLRDSRAALWPRDRLRLVPRAPADHRRDRVRSRPVACECAGEAGGTSLRVARRDARRSGAAPALALRASDIRYAACLVTRSPR